MENEMRDRLNREYAEKLEKQVETFKEKEKGLTEKEEKLSAARKNLEEHFKTELAKRQKEQEELIRKQAVEEQDFKVKALQEENKTKQEELKALKTKEFEFEQKEKEWKEKTDNAELELKKRLLAKEEELREQFEARSKQIAEILLKDKENELKRKQEELNMELAKKNQDAIEKARQEEQMKNHELQKQLDDQKKMVEEMKKKVDQGSMQLQGEVQELALEELLRSSFPFDKIEEVAKGVRGADAIQIVRNQFGQECGKIIYESKRTKTFGGDWIEKLKSDMRAQTADVAVLVTEVMPRDLNHFGQKNGVWICSFTEVKAVAYILRDGIIKINGASKAQENKGDKIQMLYNYLI
ncbi:MAG TPA: DUF2130 domain-containing protein, partial [Nitrosopumilaceae archaeon]|nr:DUF2130 domain-containing protein [Nitrosopumilaceae archaeon]